MRLRFIVLLSIFTIFISVIHSTDAFALRWHQIRSSTHDDINGIYFLSDSLGFGVTKRGTILKFEYMQLGWRVSKIEEKCAFEGVYFLDDGSKGFAFGSNGLVYTTLDTGKTWMPDSLASYVRFYDMLFTDSLNGLIIGNSYRSLQNANGVVYKTSDGGQTWDSLNVEGWRLEAIDNSSGDIITIAGRIRMLYSLDNGQTWQYHNIEPKLSPCKVQMLDSHGMMVGMGGYFAVTEDTGQTWNQRKNIPEGYSLFDILMLDKNKAYTVSVNGEILYTDDGGKNWIPEASGTGEDLFKITRAGQRLFVCGAGGALVYADLDD